MSTGPYLFEYDSYGPTNWRPDYLHIEIQLVLILFLFIHYSIVSFQFNQNSHKTWLYAHSMAVRGCGLAGTSKMSMMSLERWLKSPADCVRVLNAGDWSVIADGKNTVGGCGGYLYSRTLS